MNLIATKINTNILTHLVVRHCLIDSILKQFLVESLEEFDWNLTGTTKISNNQSAKFSQEYLTLAASSAWKTKVTIISTMSTTKPNMAPKIWFRYFPRRKRLFRISILRWCWISSNEIRERLCQQTKQIIMRLIRCERACLINAIWFAWVTRWNVDCTT